MKQLQCLDPQNKLNNLENKLCSIRAKAHLHACILQLAKAKLQLITGLKRKDINYRLLQLTDHRRQPFWALAPIH